MKMLIDVDPVEYKKIVYCIKKFNDEFGFCNENINNSTIIDLAISKLANEYILKEKSSS
jgi:hypothetical protein